MSENPLSTIKQLVDSATEETDNGEIRFKIRTASQLIDAVQYHNEDLLEKIEDADLDNELEKQLRDMGYLE
ncbi:hypothetical protein [Halobellus ordinarius]|uniref:hypothetical protein n=1 Tax=Halobellus ordinarius TaxID=3075120 RepID=UPI0028806FD3|nr:hypothetical protein [Halobellus sp. ZY16]